MKGFLVEIVQQHRQQRAAVFAFAQAAHQRQEALHALGLQAVAVAQAASSRVMILSETIRLDVFDRWAEAVPEVQCQSACQCAAGWALSRLTSEMAVPLPPARPVRPARWM